MNAVGLELENGGFKLKIWTHSTSEEQKCCEFRLEIVGFGTGIDSGIDSDVDSELLFCYAVDLELKCCELKFKMMQF